MDITLRPFRLCPLMRGNLSVPLLLAQLLNAPGSEVGPGQVATWGKATTQRVDALGLKWEADVGDAKLPMRPALRAAALSLTKRPWSSRSTSGPVL
jgi:hypothetical protein